MTMAIAMVLLTGCSSDDAFDMTPSNIVNTGTGGVTTESGELSTFTVSIDKTSAEPSSTVAATFPEAGDDISTQHFATVVNIDMANPVAKEENGVTITVSNGHVTANHGSTEGICYTVSGSISNSMGGQPGGGQPGGRW